MSDRIRSDEGVSDIYSLAIKAVNQGGLYAGIFKEEPALSFLQQMETAAFNSLSGFYNHLVTNRYSPSEIERFLPMGMELIQKWGSDEEDTETRQVLKEYPNIITLYSGTSCVYAREIYKHMKPGDRITLKLPRFKEFYLCFLKRLARDPFVRSPTYFRGSKIVERKLVHMDALRYAFENCVRNGIEVKEAGEATSVASSPAASSPSPSPVPYARSVGVGKIARVSDYRDDEDDIRPEDSASNAPTPYISPFAKPESQQRQTPAPTEKKPSPPPPPEPSLKMMPIQLGTDRESPKPTASQEQKQEKEQPSPREKPEEPPASPEPRAAGFDLLPSPALSSPKVQSPSPAYHNYGGSLPLKSPARSPVRIAEFVPSPQPSQSLPGHSGEHRQGGTGAGDDEVRMITVRRHVVDLPDRKGSETKDDASSFSDDFPLSEDMDDFFGMEEPTPPDHQHQSRLGFDPMDDPWGGEDVGPPPPPVAFPGFSDMKAQRKP
jgi:hypothetical protein